MSYQAVDPVAERMKESIKEYITLDKGRSLPHGQSARVWLANAVPQQERSVIVLTQK